MDISNQAKDIDMQPKAPTFGLGSHGMSSNIVGRPGAQYATEQPGHHRLLNNDGQKTQRQHGGGGPSGFKQSVPGDVLIAAGSDPSMGHVDSSRYQSHQAALGQGNMNKISSGGKAAAPSSHGITSTAGPNHRKNSKSSYHIIQHSLQKTKSAKIVAPSNKFSQHGPGAGAASGGMHGALNRQSVPYLNSVNAGGNLTNQKSASKIMKANLAPEIHQMPSGGKMTDSPEIMLSHESFLQTKKQIHRAAFNYSLQDQSDPNAGTSTPNQVLAQSVIGQSNTNLGIVPKTGKLTTKFTLDLKNFKRMQPPGGGGLTHTQSLQDEMTSLAVTTTLTARKKQTNKKKTKKNSVVFDSDIRSLQEFNASGNSALKFKKGLGNAIQQNWAANPIGSQEVPLSSINSIKAAAKQGSHPGTAGMKSARSFTQHNKDLDMDNKEGKKNMTATFSRGTVANEALGGGNSLPENRRGEQQETFKYSKDSNQLLLNQNKDKLLNPNRKPQQPYNPNDMIFDSSRRVNDKHVMSSSLTRQVDQEGYGQGGSARASSGQQRSLGRTVLSSQIVNPLNQNLEFLHTAKRAIRKLESSQDNQKIIDPYMLNTTRDRQGTGAELLQGHTPTRQGINPKNAAGMIDRPDTFDTDDQGTNSATDQANQIRLKHMLQMRHSHNISQQHKVNFIKQNIQDVKDVRSKRLSKMSNKQSPRNSSYDRGSQVRAFKPLRNANKNTMSQGPVDLMRNRSISANDTFHQVRGLNQTNSMANLVNQAKQTQKEPRKSYKELKENPNEPFKNEIKSLIIMNPSFNQTQMTLTNQQLRDGVPQGDQQQVQNKEHPQSSKSSSSYLNNFRSKKGGDPQKKNDMGPYSVQHQTTDSNNTTSAAIKVPNDNYQTETSIPNHRSRDFHKQFNTLNDLDERAIQSEQVKNPKMKSTFPNLRKSVHSSALSHSSSKASPLNQKRRSKNERQNIKGLTNNVGYKNPYVIQPDNALKSAADDDSIHPLKTSSGVSSSKKRNNHMKLLKSNPVNSTEKKPKAETPRNGLVSPRFEQSNMLNQYNTEAQDSSNGTNQSPSQNRLTRQQRRQTSIHKQKDVHNPLQSKDTSFSATNNQSTNRKHGADNSFNSKSEPHAQIPPQQHPAHLVEQSFQEGNTGGQLNEDTEEFGDPEPLGSRSNVSTGKQKPKVPGEALDQMFPDHLQPSPQAVHPQQPSSEPQNKLGQLNDLKFKMKNVINKYKQKQLNDQYMINYLQNENKKLKMENERLAAALAAKQGHHQQR